MSEFRETDALQRFSFESLGVRGELVRLDDSFRELVKDHDYPAQVLEPLGQSLAAVSLLAASIKFDGSLIMQTHTDGPLHTLVAQSNNTGQIRGLARWKDDVTGDNIEDALGNGRLVMTVDGEGTERYQGIVAMQNMTIADAIEDYFERSEQLPTRLWLFGSEAQAAGLLLQQLPEGAKQPDDWNRLIMIADTIKAEEPFTLSAKSLLRRLFSEDSVRLFESKPMSFFCACSNERIGTTLVAMGREECDQILQEQEAIEVTCEFCNKHYRYDVVDIAVLFEGGESFKSETRH